MFAYLRSLLSRRPAKASKTIRRARLDLELLERRETPATYSKLALDFGPLASPVQKGFTGVNAGAYQAKRGYGWVPSEDLSVVDRGVGTRLTRDFLQASDHSFKASVRTGWYQVTVWFGDASLARSAVDIRGENVLVASIPATAAGEWTAKTFYVRVTDGMFNLRFTAAEARFAINGLKFVKVTAPPPDTEPVNSNGPIATFANAGAVNEGSTGTVSFTGATGGAGGYKYSYDFDNNGTFEVTGSTNASATVPAAYLNDGPGSRIVRGRITDSAGAFNSYTTTISISNVAPSVTLSNRTGNTTSPLSFSAVVSDPGIDAFTYLWNFGDGTTSTLANPSKQYTAIGTYTVTLKVTDSDGAATTKTATATISLPGPVGEIIDTGHDKIPNFGATPTIVAIGSGNWSSPATWLPGRVPQAGDIVAINNTFTVTYDLVSDAALNTVVINAGGKLIFRTDVDTRLTVINFLVLEGGELRIGTEAVPVAANKRAEVIFADVPIDLTKDPSQYGNGLIALGKVTMHGAVKSDSFIRLAVEPKIGDTTLKLSKPAAGWQVGDRLVIPDSKHWAIESYAYVPEWEEVTIASISADGLTLTLTTAIQFNHPGARDGDGVLEFLPHVGNRTRNVLLRSASANGTRGHVMFTYHADIDIRYVGFAGLGRTTIDPINNTTYDSAGAITNIGTNQAGRHPIHFSHLYGPQTTPANGYQYTFVGNAVFCPMPDHRFKWGVTINDSHYGLIQNNFIYNWAGSGLVTQTGNESFNVIERNFALRGRGEGGRDGGAKPGDEGVAFWFRGPNNYIRDNVGANFRGTGAEAAYGFKLFFVYLGNVRIPNFKGADTSIAGQYTVRHGNAMPLLEFDGNETYGVENGLTIWWLNAIDVAPQNGGNSVVKDFLGWHISRYGFYGYPMADVTFDGYTIRGNKAVLSNRHEFLTGMWFGDYMTKDVVIRNADIQGMRTGIVDPYFGGYTTIIENSYLRNSTNILVRSLGAPGSGPNGAWRDPKNLIIKNVRFGSTAGWNLGGVTPYNISMSYTTHGGTANLIASDTVFVYDYNGITGNNFRVYYKEQASDFVVPKSSGNLVGSPVEGLTNQQNWDLYGIAIAGAVATDVTTDALINGLVGVI
jgi:PKD repeat protein